MILDLVATLLGASLLTLAIYNVFKGILFKLLEQKTTRYISFIGSTIFILCFTSFTMGIVQGFITYVPLLFIWLVIDLIKLSKKNINKSKVDRYESNN